MAQQDQVSVKVVRSDIVPDGEPEWHVRVENTSDQPIYHVSVVLWYDGRLLGNIGPHDSLRPCLAAFTYDRTDWPAHLLRRGDSTPSEEELQDLAPPGLVAELRFVDANGAKRVRTSDAGGVSNLEDL